MFGWLLQDSVAGGLVVAAYAGAIAMTARRYVRSGGVSNYSGEDAERIKRLRVS